jgi:hypothetical protein
MLNSKIKYLIAIIIILFLGVSIYGLFGRNKLPKITYNVSFPKGILPYPHHNPNFTQKEYDSLINNVIIINNFGLYQCGNHPGTAYFHDGLDFVLKKGTKIYAVESGYVKFISESSNEFYRSIIIGDTKGDEPGNAWVYVHVNNFQVKNGDYVPQGTYIADVHFRGLDHVHLGRAYLSSGEWSNVQNLNYVQPDKYFIFPDTQPPVIENPFYYFSNNSDGIFLRDSLKGITEISGEVDIVTGIREAGQYANTKDGNGWIIKDFGDRLCISKIEYEIYKDNILLLSKKSFDFSKLTFNFSKNGYKKVLVVYKYRPVIQPNVTSWSRIFSYFIITNTDGTGDATEIKTSDSEYSWNTLQKDSSGNSLFPNGRYSIKVIAYDFKGNRAESTDFIEVNN